MADTQDQTNQETDNDFAQFELSNLFDNLKDVVVEGGIDAELDDASCPGGACKI